MISTVSASSYDAARRGAACIDRSDRGRILVNGSERASYLQGLLTNDIVALTPGRGCYAAYLTAQGRMIADLWVYEIGDVILLTMNGEVKDTVLARLDQFIFSEDVQLGDVTGALAQIAVIGPRASASIAAIVPAISADALDELPEHGNLRADWEGSPVIVTRITDAGVPGFDIYIEGARKERVLQALEQDNVTALDAATADALRIEAGVPLFHRDMDEETIPLEAGIESRAISLTKGCYVGQEIIIRVLHRGHGRVARRLVGLRFAGDAVPANGAAISAGEKAIGEVTSAILSPALHAPIALAYVHRDFAEPGTHVTVDGADADVTALPFV